jgi:DNA-nicking Smr family endonuclease
VANKINTTLLKAYMMGASSPSKEALPTKKIKDSVDLHLYDKMPNGKKDEKYALEIQLEQFEKIIDDALSAGKWEIRLIHGNGSGKLKKEIHRLLARNPHVRSFENSYHSQYGWGSTLVIFK